MPIFPYRFRAWVSPEDNGGFMVYIPELPGCASQGETIEECINSITEAFHGVAKSYIADGENVPWCKDNLESECPHGSVEVLISTEVEVDT